ncbi:MAG: hypothetical protein EOP47_21655 [Sphingobacteriaceae bacterium]|nr:MAG: hypothetical protein EOP47_21655 [Sphingobacteriaceae bacterium]
MKKKNILKEFAWLGLILLLSYVLLVAIGDFKLISNEGFHQTIYIIDGLAFVSLVFIFSTAFIYFVKAFINKFNSPLQNWIGYISLALSCTILTIYSFLYGGFIEAAQKVYLADGMRSPLIPSSFADSLISDAYNIFALAILRTIYVILLLVMILKARKAKAMFQTQ